LTTRQKEKVWAGTDEPHRGMDTDNGSTSALDGVVQLAIPLFGEDYEEIMSLENRDR
jgi:hypothetical protein